MKFKNFLLVVHRQETVVTQKAIICFFCLEWSSPPPGKHDFDLQSYPSCAFLLSSNHSPLLPPEFVTISSNYKGPPQTIPTLKHLFFPLGSLLVTGLTQCALLIVFTLPRISVIPLPFYPSLLNWEKALL